MRRFIKTRKMRLAAFIALAFAQQEAYNQGRGDLSEEQELIILREEFPDAQEVKVQHLRNVVNHVWSRPRLFEPFTELMKKLMANHECAEQGYAEISAWGAPSECRDDVQSMYEREVVDLLTAYCATPTFLYRECYRRGLNNIWMDRNMPPLEYGAEDYAEVEQQLIPKYCYTGEGERILSSVYAEWSKCEIGETVGVSAAAPGTGRTLYKITRITDEGVYGVIIEDTVRILSPAEVV